MNTFVSTSIPTKLQSLYWPVMDNGSQMGRIGWAMSMVALAASDVLKGRDVLFEGYSYPYPDGNANIATQSFLEIGYDKMVIFDVDVIFTPQHARWLLSHDEGIVCGIVPKKKPGLEYSIIPLASNPDPFSGPDDLCEVDRACRGCMTIHRRVFETLKKHPRVKRYMCLETGRLSWEFWRNVPGGTSDDFEFCRRWREMGGKVYVDRRVTLQHAGNTNYPIKGTY
jgi:hypothetical protein